MDCEWKPVQEDLGDLGFAGICRETTRVLIRYIHPTTGRRAVADFAILLALFIAQIAAGRALDSSGLLLGIAYTFSILLCMLFILALSIMLTTSYALRVATLYCTDGDSGAADRVVRDLPCAPIDRLILISITVLPIANLYFTLSTLAWLELPQLDPSDKVVVLALQLLGGAAFLAGAVYITVLSHMVCVVAHLEELEDDVGFSFVLKSRALLAGKFWAAAAVFVPLDCCFVALRMYFPDLVFDDAPGLGRVFLQVAAGVAMAMALWAVMVVTLVAQPVVYLVCKNYHKEVVDKVHLNYVGEYQRLDDDGDSGLELQAAKTEEQIPDASQCPPAGQSLAGSST